MRKRSAIGLSLLLGLWGCERSRPVPVLVASVEVTPAVDTLEACPSETDCPRSTTLLKAVVRDERGRMLTGRRVAWESTSGAVAVDSLGVARAGSGFSSLTPSVATVEVRATSEGVTGSATLVVFRPVLRLVADAPPRLLAGKRSQLKSALVVHTSRAQGQSMLIAPSTHWSSSDTSVLTVDPGGLAWARRPGTVTVTALAMDRQVRATVEVVDHGGYSVTDLGSLGGERIIPAEMNDRGQVVGAAQTVSGEWHAFVWEAGRLTDLGTAGLQSRATSVNAGGEIVGWSMRAGAPGLYPVLWRERAPTFLIPDLLTRPIERTVAQAIDDQGRVVLVCHSLCGPHPGGSALRWQEGELMLLDPAPGAPRDVDGVPLYHLWLGVGRLNGQGSVVGTSRTQLASGDPGTENAIIWRQGVVTTLASSSRSPTSGSAVNARGQVVGFTSGGRFRPSPVYGFLWQDGKQDTLAHPSGEQFPGMDVLPEDLNAEPAVVGAARDPFVTSRGFVWRGGRMYWLSDLVRGEEWEITRAVAINGAGWIVAEARSRATQASRAVLLIPES